MPELPEVELYRRHVDEHALDQTISKVEVIDERILHEVDHRGLSRALRDQRFVSTHRHGKHLFVETSGKPWLHIHFGMTGDILYYTRSSEAPRYARAIFHFSSGAHLAYDDARLFGWIGLVGNPDEAIARRRLGPDPLDPSLTARRFGELLSRRRGAIKPVLMGQQVVAGLGNLYVDELLFDVAVHPQEPVENLGGRLVSRMFRTMITMLHHVIEIQSHNRRYPARFLLDHRKEGARCPLDGATIRKITVGGRSTYYCTRHQKQGRAGRNR